MAIRYKGYIISSWIYKGEKLSSIRRKSELIWEAIKSCFGKGYWINDYPWNNTDAWNNKPQ